MKHDVGMAGEYTKWENTEAKELKKIEEDVGRLEAKSQELEKNKERLRKKLDHSRQELDHTHKRLAGSQKKYTAIEKKLDQVREELVSEQAQLDERSTLSTSHNVENMLEGKCAQRLKLLDDVRITSLTSWLRLCN